MSFNPRQCATDILGKSKAHLHDVQENYWSHMRFALYAVWMMGSAMVLLLVHLLVPAWFQCSAGNRILKLAQDMQARRDRIGGCPE